MNANESEIKQTETLETAPMPLVFPKRYLRFGAFELDLQREDLSKDGERIRLQGKVYQTLLILLSRAGSVVTREEVRRRLWPENLQVNFDANVNTTMNKLRQALGDSPENPVYIETIPRRGYCFLAEVEYADSSLPASTRIAEPRGGSEGHDASMLQTDTKPKFVVSMGWRVAILVLAGMIVGALLVLAWYSYAHRASGLGSRSRAEHKSTATVAAL